MPKRGVAALFVTIGVLVLLLNFKTPDQTLPSGDAGIAIVEPTTKSNPTGGTGTAVPTPTRSTGGATSTPGTATPAPTATTGGSSGSNATVDGPAVSTRFGTIQVEVVISGGKIKDVVALQLPTGRRSGQISTYSAPILRQEALTAQNASINTVSGATYTSDAYAQSLQAALDQAGLG
jgi:uncharacterized protein with FMN-binding domain